MSIHSLAKELGVSEYALRQYAKNHNIKRKSADRRSGYEFTKENLADIKQNYGSKPEPEVLILMYRIYDKKNRNHLFLPAGFIPRKNEELLKEFISFQCFRLNGFHKKGYNFFICSKQQYKTRLNKLKNAMGTVLFNRTIAELIPNFITPENLPLLVNEKKFIKYEDFVPEIARIFFAGLKNLKSTAKMEEVSFEEKFENEIGSYDESADENDSSYSSDDIDFS